MSSSEKKEQIEKKANFSWAVVNKSHHAASLLCLLYDKPADRGLDSVTGIEGRFDLPSSYIFHRLAIMSGMVA